MTMVKLGYICTGGYKFWLHFSLSRCNARAPFLVPTDDKKKDYNTILSDCSFAPKKGIRSVTKRKRVNEQKLRAGEKERATATARPRHRYSTIPFRCRRGGDDGAREMSFFFRMASRMRPSTPEEVVRSIKDSFLALPTKTGARALEEVEKNISSLRQLLSGDGEAEPNQEQVLQIALEICKEDVLSLFVQNLPSLGWGVRKDLANCWCILLGQKVDENYCCVKYIEDHAELLDFLVGCYKNLDVALNCGNMLRECIKYPTLAKYILESNSFELFFDYVELPNFDIASDALNTFKDLLTKHETVVSEFLGSHYQKFFELYTRILTSDNYVTRRQSVKFLSEFLLEASNSKIMKRFITEVHFLNIMIGLLKDSSKNIRICAFHVFKVFVANPNKPRSIVEALRENRRELLKLLHNLPASKGEDELDEERDLIIQAIEKL